MAKYRLAEDKKHWITANGAHFLVDENGEGEKPFTNQMNAKKEKDLTDKDSTTTRPRNSEEIDKEEWYYTDRHGKRVRTRRNQEKKKDDLDATLPRSYRRESDKPLHTSKTLPYRPTHANDADIFAFDKSVRNFDVDGRLHVATTNISKAMVCPYLGSEIPGYQQLGLDANRVYQLLRDPEELKKAASTFNNLQVLEIHKPVNASESLRENTVGTTGSDVTFDGTYLKCSMAIWDAAAIAGIESKQQTELSSAYRYTPDMTPGVFNGVAYDGVMRDIIGNHVALVEVGRAGHDVIVADKQIARPQKLTRQGEKIMTITKKDARSALRVALAQDAEIDKELLALALDEDTEEDNDDEYEDDPENTGKRRKKVVAQDGDETEEDEEDKKPAMDAAQVQLAIDSAVKIAKSDMEALHQARKDVAPLVGEVAMDSAEAVYKFALDNAKIDTKGVHPSAFKSLVSMLKTTKDHVHVVTMDSNLRRQTAEKIPGINRFRGAL